MDAYKSSGPGGQHCNKRESAVRLKHVPTGVIVHAAEDRSQHKNRASALSHSFGPQIEGSVSEAAKFLGLSTGALSRLILSDDSLRMAVNEFRTSKGMKPLKQDF
ncbi:RF PROK I domain-containing protein [Citrus sinensis]|uniref:RF PROK I domain-containing protein n=1 Tax=Citrus sinensis TaxID=2711 RepID=A0ACB8M9Z2_CITSI|nr:RF PROK I domain-containing protein [Citrus sinensis]